MKIINLLRAISSSSRVGRVTPCAPSENLLTRWFAGAARRGLRAPPILTFCVTLAFPLLASAADTTLLYNAIVHTGTGETFTNSGVLIEGQKISLVMNGKNSLRMTVHQMIDLKGQHIYPGLIALDTVLGLTEIDAVRATQDANEVGDYTPDVESW